MIDTSRGQRLHIAFFGNRNAGKSSLINALTAQPVSLVSEVPGTTTDPVSKAMEILPIGPVMLTDTAGLDDAGELGAKRVQRSLEVLASTDLALIVIPASAIDQAEEQAALVLAEIRKRELPAILVLSKSDLHKAGEDQIRDLSGKLLLPVVQTSAEAIEGIEALKMLIIQETKHTGQDQAIVSDLFKPGETVVLVVPIDTAAPKGRLILPQVQCIRDILDNDGQALVVKERELSQALAGLKTPPALVITDSQAFQKAAADTPPEVPLSSFSIIFARHKGSLEAYIRGIRQISSLKNGSRILIAESCTHHLQSDDIGTVKIPRWLRDATGKELVFEHSRGRAYPTDLSRYSLIVHCGGCMLTRREVMYRIQLAEDAGVAITNYGMLIAEVFGILPRALKPFPLASALLEDRLF